MKKELDADGLKIDGCYIYDIDDYVLLQVKEKDYRFIRKSLPNISFVL